MKVSKLPAIINVEVIRGICPCNCVHCPVGILPQNKREEYLGIRHMDINIFKKICNEICCEKGVTLRLHGVGEPILWNDLLEAITYTKERNIITWIFTSLVTNDYNILKMLCENVSIIEVSVNADNEKDYYASKGINEFNKVKSNIEFMSRYIKENQLNSRLIVSRVQTEDEAKNKAFVSYWMKTGLVKDAFIREYHSYNHLLKELKDEETMYKEPCIVHWKRFNISIDGKVIVCFNELFKQNIMNECYLGDIKEKSVEEIWHSDRLEEIRKADIENKYDKKFSKDFPCRKCLNCQGKEDRVTSEFQVAELQNVNE